MDNDYCYTSFTIPLTPEQMDWAINEILREDNGSCGVDCHRAEVDSIGDRKVDIVSEPNCLWIHHDTSVDPGVLAERLQNIMSHFGIPGTWVFAYSEDCDGMRPNAYGGGAVLITQSAIDSMHTTQWINERGIT